jgi:hypothetical protein
VGIFFFGLPIYRIESSTATVTTRLYSDLDVDPAPATSSSTVWHGRTRRTRDAFKRCSRLLSFVWSSSTVCLRHRRPGLHRPRHHQLRSMRRRQRHPYVDAMGLINRPSAFLRQARANHRPSIGLSLCHPFGPQCRRPWSKAAGFQRAFLGAYVASGHAAASTRALQLRRPFGV